jgi:hypothetical protein
VRRVSAKLLPSPASPVIASNIRAASITVLVIGPGEVSDVAYVKSPLRLIAPTVGRNPTQPLSAAGSEIDAQSSTPTAPMPKLSDTATADPLLEPPGGFLAS